MAANKNQRDLKTTIKSVFTVLRKIFTLNIGTLLFGALFIYIIFSLLLYVTSSKVVSYQVISGPLSRNETYTGLALHEEEVISAGNSGYVNYYAREGTKINANGIVYGLSNEKTSETSAPLNQEDLSRIRQQMSSFSYGFDSNNFNNTYSFKYELEGNILQYSGANEVPSDSEAHTEGDEEEDQDELQSAVTLGNQTLCRAREDGIVLYSRDGYEEKTAENLTKADFDQNSYHETDLKTKEQVEAGDEIYTLITDERWSLYIPLSSKQEARLSDRTSIRVKFLKDGITQNGDFSIVEIDDAKYGKIDFNNGLIRYASDRFLDIELVTNIQSGLKIPISSVVNKEFYVIPVEYQTKGGSENEAGFLREVKGKDGSNTTEFVSATLYSKQNNMFYVEKSVFDEGDVLIKPNTNDRYVVGDVAALEGVYCINKGYAVFRRITIIDQNEEYCIVEKGTAYGLAQYDHIVMDASKVEEEDVLY